MNKTNTIKSKNSSKMGLFRAFLAGAVLLAALVSCAGGPQGSGSRTVTSGPFFITVYGETVPAFDDSALAEAEMDISLALADTEQTPLSGIVRSALYGGQTAEEYAAKVLDDWKTTYRATLDENNAWGFDQSWGYNEEHAVQINGPYAVVSQSIYHYMGGAHGNQLVRYYVFDMSAPKQLAVGDLVSAESFSKLTDYVNRKLRRYSETVGGKPLPDRLPLTAGIFNEETAGLDDFYPAGEGLHIQWDPYEIAAYAYGSIEVVISWEELTGILSPDGLRLAEAFNR